MLFLAATRWQIATALRSPSTWILLASVGIAWPTINTLMGLGLTTAARPPESVLWQIGWIATCLGCTLSLYRLCKQSWWTARAQPVLRALLEVGSIATLGWIFLVASTVLAAPSVGVGNLFRLWGAGALAGLHAGILGSLLLALPASLPPGWKAGLFPVIAWVLPASISGAHFPGRTLRQTLEIARYFEFPLEADPSASLWWTPWFTLFGLALLRLAVLFACQPEPCATPSSETSTPT